MVAAIVIIIVTIIVNNTLENPTSGPFLMLFPLPEIPSHFSQLTPSHDSGLSLNFTSSRVPSLRPEF